jgi:hypothetical protein
MRAWSALFVVACARHPHVVPIDFGLYTPDDADDVATLGLGCAEGLRHDLARGRLVELRAQGRTLGDDELLELPADVATAAYSLTIHPRAHEHIDLLLQRPDGDVRPLTLVVDARVLTVDWEPLRAVSRADAPASDLAREALVRRFGLGAIADEGGVWTEGDLAVLDHALAHIEPEVLSLLVGMPFLRQGVSPRAGNRELAWFDPGTEPPTIEVYDLAFAPGDGAVGPTDDLVPLATMTLVHEIGHVLADAPLRRAWLHARDADMDELAWGGPVIRGWRRVRDHRGPTPYGRRDAHESFAEAYALHILDPDALEEVMPAGAAWFAAGEHIRLAGLKADRP